jgi:hypothetical protein
LSRVFSVFDTWSIAKVPSGILHGVRRNYGLFTECVNFGHQSNSTAVGFIQGKYCLVDYKTLNNGTQISETNKWIDER